MAGAFIPSDTAGRLSVAAFQKNDEQASDAKKHENESQAIGPSCLVDRSEIGKVELAGRMCRVLLVDGMAPCRCEIKGTKRVQLTYAEGEIVHFDFGGHRYVLIAEIPGHANAAPPSDKASTMPLNISTVLSGREMEVVHLVCMGLLTKQVAERLNISEFTVRSYLKTIYAKLGVRSRAALVFRFMKAFSTWEKTKE
jgi:DNA-binding CsgD family transcriptional regulator